MKNLAESCILVNIRFGQWSAKKYDKKISGEIERQHNATNAGRYNKSLIGDEYLKDIQSIVSAARTFLKERTLPWGDNSDRLLLAAEYLPFLNEFRKYKDQFDQAVQKFIEQYPKLKKEAQWRLNGLFREADYPIESSLKKKFYIEVTCLPIANLDDMRVKIDVADVEREYASRIAEATQDIWQRISKTVGHMVDRLSHAEHKFKDSLVTNIRELVALLPKLNFSEDKNITEVTETLRSLLVDPDDLRTNDHFRNQKAREAQGIMNKISSFMTETT